MITITLVTCCDALQHGHQGEDEQDVPPPLVHLDMDFLLPLQHVKEALILNQAITAIYPVWLVPAR